MTEQRKNDEIKVRLPANLKAEAMKATQERRGGISALVRELLVIWLAQQKKSPAHRG
jgi:hypothetical protein